MGTNVEISFFTESLMKDRLYILVAVECLFYIIIPAFLLIG